MSTDRELLEMAAKAAGYTTNHPWNAERLTFNPPVYALYVMNENGVVNTAWNPLDDSGAALNLAVKLEIELWIGNGGTTAGGLTMDVDEDFGSDPYAATRRAIVRAAAEIGKAMP